MAIEKMRCQKIAKWGLYSVICHPHYLGNTLLFCGCPLFMASRLPSIPAAAEIIGILIRIEIDEEFLLKRFEG